MYWDIGSLIHRRQQKEGWGSSIILRLAKDIVNELPEVKGFSERNLNRMLRFYKEYALNSENSISGDNSEFGVSNVKVPQAVAQLPWGHNIWFDDHFSSEE